MWIKTMTVGYDENSNESTNVFAGRDDDNVKRIGEEFFCEKKMFTNCMMVR